jgi:hypothetical protein
MRTYRIVSPEGAELAAVEASTLLDAMAKHPIDALPVGAQLVEGDGSHVLARCELWLESCPGWSLVTLPQRRARPASPGARKGSDAG